MADKLKELLGLLEKRLVEHDNSRKEVQGELEEIRSRMNEGANSLEEKISGGINKDSNEKEEQIFGLIEKLNEGGDTKGALTKQAQKILSNEWKYEIRHSDSAKTFVDSYRLEISSVRVGKKFTFDNTDSIVSQLQEHLGRIQESATVARDKLTEICNNRREEGEELGNRINGELEVAFSAEDARIQSVVKVVRERIGSENPEEVSELARKAKLTLLKNQKYRLAENGSHGQWDLKVEREASLKLIEFEERKPANLVPLFTKKGELSLSFSFFNNDETDVLKGVDSHLTVEVKILEKGHEEGTSKSFTAELTLGSDEPVCFRNAFAASTTYCLKMRMISQGMNTQWSDGEEFTPDFKDCCVWKECPVGVSNRYSVDEKNPRIVTSLCGGFWARCEYLYKSWCTIIGSTPLPPNKVTSWTIKVLESGSIDGYGNSDMGVAQFDINQNENYVFGGSGWYIDSYRLTLFSGPPHNYKYPGKEYGPRKLGGQYVHTGDSVGVVMDTSKGELSFVLNGVNYGVAFEGIPLDKPLVPCVHLGTRGDSIELNTSEVKEKRG